MLRAALTATGLALAGGLGVLAVNSAGPANAQAEFTVSAQQLRINQRISQAGVRRANEALTQLEALSDAGHARFFGTVFRPPLPGEPVPQANIPPGGLPKHSSASVTWQQQGVAHVRPEGGLGTFCTPLASLQEGPGEISAARVPAALTGESGVVEVRTYASDGTPTSRTFALAVFCP